MKPEQIFIGNIKKCTKYEEQTTFKCEAYFGDTPIFCDTFGSYTFESELYKENATLIKLKNGGYVDIDNLNTILDYMKMHKDITKNGFRTGGLIMSEQVWAKDSLFIDCNSLKSYYQNPEEEKNISIKKLRKNIKITNKK